MENICFLVKITMNTNNIICKNFIKNDTGYVHFAGYSKSHYTAAKKSMRILGSHAIAYLISGQGFYIDQTGFKKNLIPGDLIFVDPKLPHQYGPIENHIWEEIYFVFGGENFDHISDYAEIIKQNRVGKLLPIAFHKKELFELMNSFQAAEPKDTFYLVSKIQMLIAKAFREPNASIQQNSLDNLNEGILYIKKNATQEIDMKKLAAQLNMTYESFRKKFKQATGLSPVQYKLSAVMEIACHQLLSTNKKIKTIAEELHFCSEFFFSQQFKKNQGIPPKKYREVMINTIKS